MAVVEYLEFIQDCRKQFREIINNNDTTFYGAGRYVLDFFRECSNQFEEDTLKENLQEEFGLYLDSLKKAE